MPKNFFPRRKPRFAFLLPALLSLFLLGAAPHQIAPVASVQTLAKNPTSDDADRRDHDKQERSAATAALLNLPLSFEPGTSANQFFVRGSGYRLMLTGAQATIVVASRSHEKFLSLKLAGAKVEAQAEALNPLPGKRNYLIGDDPARWRTNVPTYAGVRYDEVYPGISVLYYGRQDRLEYDFKIAPGADPKAIRFNLNRELKPRIETNGDLVLRFAGGELREPKPTIYQELAGERRPVAGRYVITGRREIAFEIGAYDLTRPLVIDPVLVFSTYLGGSGDDPGSSIAVDTGNNVYIAGTTNSANFPTQGPAFPNKAGLSDIFVTKINAAGNAIVYSTYVGGSGLDRGDGLAIDASGNAYVVGRVDSSSTNFPTTPGVIGPTYRGGDFDGVAFKLNAQGNALLYSTYIGGEDNDSTEGIAVDSAGSVYLTGGTRSQGFPVTATGAQFTRSGDTDAYLMRLNSTATGLIYSTFLGGAGTDRGSGVAIDGNGKAYVAGYTSSQDFPTESAFQNSFGGSFDAFLAKFDTNSSGASSLMFCTYLGGTGDDKAYGIDIDNGANNVYVVGQTSSNNLPLLNPAQPAFGGSFDAFIAKISSTGVKVYTTYLGGTGDDRATGVKVNSSGEAYVTGFTSSTNFPTVTPLQISNGGGFDAFVAKLNSAGSTFLYSTYLGGSGNESNTTSGTSTNPIALDAVSDVYLTGFTSSTNFPTVTPLQPANAGGQDAFLVKITDAVPAADYSISIVPGSRTVVPGGGTTYTVTATPASGFTGTITLAASGFSNDSTASFNPPTIVITDLSAKSSTLTVTTTAATPPGTYALNINTTSGNLQHAGAAQLVVSGTASANLAISKTASPNPATSLANLTYRIVVTNNGPSPATNVSVTDQLAAGPAFVSAIPTQGNCSGPPAITCSLGSIANGAVAIINITITPQTTGQLTNTASVVAAESDPDASDNSSTIQTTVNAPANGPSMLDPNLSVKTVVTGLSQPTSMAFIGNNDFLVLEKNTGKVQRVVNGAVQGTVLDLAVNSASERGLLGIALHPNLLFNGYVYLYWTESSTGVDSTNLADVALLGNRVDRYIWNGSTLVFDRNLIHLHAFQADANQPLRGNHNGGVLRFGPDGKLYILMGDNGRRGLLQNNQLGPVPDDQFGGPEPDDNHLTGFILRLNDDGSTPTDNPFFNASTALTGQAAANIKKLYAYGVRNGFGLGFDPLSGNLWDQENGDDAFDEMNRVTAGSNNGWVEMMGPNSRVAQFKQIESTYGTGDLQQVRWPPSQIADTPAAALARLYMLPGAHYNDPEFSWKYAIPASPLGFVSGRGLGPQFEGDMFVGAARTFLVGGFLFRFKLTPDRLHFAFTDPRLNDLVADNLDKFDITESESLLIGRDFGITTDIETGPNGDLFIVSNTNSAVYEVSGKQPALFTANLNGAQETPPNNSPATGTATLLLSPDETTARVALNFSGLTTAQTNAHIHGPAAPGVAGNILFPLPNGSFSDFLISLSAADVTNLKSGQLYINVHSSSFLNGEIRGQFGSPASASSVQFSSANYFVSEAAGRANITVTRIGDTTSAASVTYSTNDAAGLQNCNVTNGVASPRCDYINTLGTLTFAAGETFKTFSVPLVDDGYAEGNESFTISLSSPSGAVPGSPNTATVTVTDNETANGTNPIDDTNFFVRQQYIDFLGREPDPPGFAGWTATINNCSGDTTQCDRIHVSQLFFQSAEFQDRGYFVYRFYPVAFGRKPDYSEFVPDLASVSGFLDANQLEAAKVAFIAGFMARTAFVNTYNGLTNQQYVDALLNTAGVTLSNRQAMIDGLNNSTMTRAQVLRTIVESTEVSTRYNHQAYAVMEYFGYLRRQPDSFYLQWIQVLDQTNDPRGMVTGFVTSQEYRNRFGP